MKFTVRLSEEEDAKFLTKWLCEPGVLRWFPMYNQREIDDAVQIWMGFLAHGSALTVVRDGQPCGMGVLYLQNYDKFAHQCLFAILVGHEFRNQGVGTLLCTQLTELAKKQFNIEILHLEVYEGNPAYRLYERMGFKEYGVHPNFLKEEGRYRNKILMEKQL